MHDEWGYEEPEVVNHPPMTDDEILARALAESMQPESPQIPAA
jgi:hypothetical protein